MNASVIAGSGNSAQPDTSNQVDVLKNAKQTRRVKPLFEGILREAFPTHKMFQHNRNICFIFIDLDSKKKKKTTFEKAKCQRERDPVTWTGPCTCSALIETS